MRVGLPKLLLFSMRQREREERALDHELRSTLPSLGSTKKLTRIALSLWGSLKIQLGIKNWDKKTELGKGGRGRVGLLISSSMKESLKGKFAYTSHKANSQTLFLNFWKPLHEPPHPSSSYQQPWQEAFPSHLDQFCHSWFKHRSLGPESPRLDAVQLLFRVEGPSCRTFWHITIITGKCQSSACQVWSFSSLSHWAVTSEGIKRKISSSKMFSQFMCIFKSTDFIFI